MKSKLAIIILIFTTLTFPVGSYLLGWIHGQRFGLSVGLTIGSNVALTNARLIREGRVNDALQAIEKYGLLQGPVAIPNQSFLPNRDEVANFAMPWSISTETTNASRSNAYGHYIADYPDHAKVK
jgi:hypothetical protein